MTGGSEMPDYEKLGDKKAGHADQETDPVTHPEYQVKGGHADNGSRSEATHGQ